MRITDQNMPLLIASLAFVVICLLSLGLFIYWRGLRQRRALLSKIQSAESAWTLDDDAPLVAGESTHPIMRFLGALGARTKSKKPVDEAAIKMKFLRGGLRGSHVPTAFWGFKCLLAVSLPLFFVLAAALFFEALSSRHLMLGAAFLALLGLMLPDVWLRSRTRERKEKLTRGFPDALDLLVVCVEAGMGLDAAISRVGEEVALSHPELSHEFKQLNLELRAGMPRQTALRNLALRTDLDDVNSLVTLLIQTDRFGTSVAQALKVYADTFRTTRFQRAEEFAAKLSTKLIFPLVFFIFPSFMVVAIGPAAVQVYRILLQK